MSSLLRAKGYVSALEAWMTKKVGPIASNKYPVELKSWFKELDLVRAQIERPDRVRIALVGTTGAGKSTFLNAVLDQELLPVGVMQPCTAFVTLVRHRSEAGYEVTVDYITEEDWRRDLRSFAALLLPGDDDAHPAETKRLVNAARKRVQAVLGSKAGPDVDPIKLVDEPLPEQVQAILRAGISQTESFDSSHEMLPFLRKLIHGESNLWPLVKQVSISGPYECLQGGLELVDLPGLNDPNEARIEVTREFLRTSPFVWVMFSMVRGLTQDIQAILGEERLLRTLVLSGSYAALSLVGTKADDIDLNMAEQLGLDEDAVLADTIAAYRGKTVEKAREQLEQMVHDLSTPADAGETFERMLALAKNVEVHATSAAAYCRLANIGRRRKDYGLASLEETGIPGIHCLLRRISEEAGGDFTARTAVERLDQLGTEISLFFQANSKAPSPESGRARRKLLEEHASLNTRVSTAEAQAKESLQHHREQFFSRLKPLFQSSIQGVRKIFNNWRSIHHLTLRAIVSGEGMFKSPSTGKSYDFNADLTDPLLNQLPVSWERYFTEDLGSAREDFVSRIRTAGIDFSQRAALVAELTLHHSDGLLDKQLAWFQEKVDLLAQTATSRLIAAITERRRDLANKIPLVARQIMIPAYTAAGGESGLGLKSRILDRLEKAALASASTIYETIQADLLEGLKDLEVIILRLFNELALTANEQAKTVAHNIAIDIDEAKLTPQVQAVLDSLPRVPN
jgi:hypothetical protein